MSLTKIIAVGPHCWGKGDDINEAVDNCFKHMPQSVTRPRTGPKPGVAVCQLWAASEGTKVNGFGGLSYDLDGPEPLALGYLDRLKKPCAAPAE